MPPDGVARSATTSTAAAIITVPTAHIPAFSDPVRSASAPVAYGATKPPRLPTELISPIPPAAAAPVRKRDGRAQKLGIALNTPIAVIVTGIITKSGLCR